MQVLLFFKFLLFLNIRVGLKSKIRDENLKLCLAFFSFPVCQRTFSSFPARPGISLRNPKPDQGEGVNCLPHPGNDIFGTTAKNEVPPSRPKPRTERKEKLCK